MMEGNNTSENDFNDILLSAVHQGDTNLLESYLSTVLNPNLYLNHVYDEANEQKCTLLMIACLNGHEDIIRMLLRRFKPDLEVLNNILLSERNALQDMLLDVSVLWAAASINNFQIVKLLVEYGANVNHTTKTNSTPLRGACYNDNLKMARYLIENGADIRIAKENNETNLMLSVWHNHLNIAAYLLDELVCDVNECDDDGYSSLYYAVHCGSLESVEFLFKHGARNFPATRSQMSPLMWAAEKRRSNLVDAISPYCSLVEQIEAKELLGSTFVCAEPNDRDLEQAFRCFYRALELRSTHNLLKPLRLTTIEIFDNRQECQTLDQLEEIRSNLDNMYIEALLIRERVLGSANGEYRYSLFYRGALFADNEQYHRTIDYWLYELTLREQYSIPLDSKILRYFASIFSEMLLKSMSAPIDVLLKIMTVITEEVEHNKKEFNYNLYTLLFLIKIITQVQIYFLYFYILKNIYSSPSLRQLFLKSIVERFIGNFPQSINADILRLTTNCLYYI
jgi:Fem-1 family protein b